jgi:hypothetical protein
MVVYAGVPTVRAKLLPILEGGSQAALAGGGVGVSAAQREGEDDVWKITDGVGGEEGCVGRALLGEGGREELEVGLVDAI